MSFVQLFISYLSRKLFQKKTVVLGIYFASWLLYFFYLWSNAFWIGKEGQIMTQQVNIWGDWAAHFTMGSAMAERGAFLKESPLLKGASFSYPFVADLISGLLAKSGVDFFMAFVLPSFLFSVVSIIMLYIFYKNISKSWVISIIASCIFLFNGGVGFYYYFSDIAKSTTPLLTALNPPTEYTNLEHLHYRWISVVTSMLIPQRAFALGFPITLFALLFVYQNMLAKKPSWIKTTVAGVLFGFLPIIHSHTFIAVFVILACWSATDVLFTFHNKKKTKQKLTHWLLLLGIVSCISLPLIQAFIHGTVSSTKFMRWYPGWYMYKEYKETETLLSFWFKNWGITPVVALAGWAAVVWKTKGSTKYTKLHTFGIYLPFFLLFLLTNLMLFQPGVWDNTKILVWASLGFSLLAGHSLYYLWHSFEKPTTLWKILVEKLLFFWKKQTRAVTVKQVLVKSVVVLMFVFMTLTGIIDAYRAIRFDIHSYGMYSREELVLAQWVKKNTPKDSVWLTATHHNHWLFNLTGRQAVMTYPGWLWTHGYNYISVEGDVRSLYLNPGQPDLIAKHGIDYAVVGPAERNNLHARDEDFKKGYEIVYRSTTNTIYKLNTEYTAVGGRSTTELLY